MTASLRLAIALIGGLVFLSAGCDRAAKREAEAEALFEMLADDVLATHRDRAAWWAMTQAMLGHLGPRVTAGRMVREYDSRFYTPIRTS